MYITDLRHFLDQNGAISPVRGPAKAMAQFQADVVAHASDVTQQPLVAPNCIKCRKAVVVADLARDEAVVWSCPKCGAEGRISNWQGSLWDLRDRPRPKA
jgi:ribosomal protein L37AE/L43A